MNDPAAGSTAHPRVPDPSLVGYVHWMYGLHALSAAIGVLGSPFVLTAFVFGMPSVIAVVMNYVRRDEARGTWLEPHFAWQLSTFWRALLWLVALSVLGAVLAVTIIGLPLVLVVVAMVVAVGVWAVYRIARGWLKLKDGREP